MKQVFLKIVAFLIALFSIFSCNSNKYKTSSSDRIIGVKIYNYSGDYNLLKEEWKDIGINTVFCSIDLFSNEGFRSFLKENKLRSFIITPVFFDPDALQMDSSLFAITKSGENAKDDWVEFVCPSRKDFRKQKIEKITKLVEELDPDGISIDFIRHFVFWEMLTPDIAADDLPNSCFDSLCLTQFQLSIDIKLPESKSLPAESAKWIEENYLEEWVDWKCNLITSMISEIVIEVKKVKPGIKINTHIVPWRQSDYNNAIRQVAGQDITEIAKYTNYLSPMTYSHMLKREPEWVHSVVEDLHKQSNSSILPSIQVNKAYLDTPLELLEFRRNLEEALKSPSAGVVFWSWQQLDDYPEKKEVIKSVLSKRE